MREMKGLNLKRAKYSHWNRNRVNIHIGHFSIMLVGRIHKDMHPLNRKNLINITNKVLKLWNSEPDESAAKIFNENNAGRGIKNFYPEEFHKFVIALSKAISSEYIPQSKIELECSSYFDKVAQINAISEVDLGHELENLQMSLESMIGEWHVVIPVDNLALENLDTINIGNIQLVAFDNIEERIKSEYYTIIDSQKFSPSETRGQKKSIFQEYVISQFKDKTCACLDITAESESLFQEAIKEVENVINLLRIYLPISANSKFIKIGLNEGRTSPITLICLRQDKQEIFIPSRRLKFNLSFKITKDIYDSLKNEYHLKDLERILCKKPISRLQYETQILNAIRWLGMGIHDQIDTDRFIKFAIALECLILTNNDRSKSEALAERCAYLIGNNQEDRWSIYREIKDLYGIRGEIVHNGRGDVPERDMNRFYELITLSLFKILDLANHIELRETNDIIKWINSNKFR